MISGKLGGHVFGRSIHARYFIIFTIYFLIFSFLVLMLLANERFSQNRDLLDQRVSNLAEAQGIVLAPSLWHLDYGRVDAIARAIGADPDIVRVGVNDEFGQPIALAGAASDGPPDETDLFLHTKTVTYIRDGEEVEIGELRIHYTDANLRVAIRNSLILESMFALLLLGGALVIAYLITRRVIIAPIRRLAEAVGNPRHESGRAFVEWNTQDEIGTLIQGFNEMQAREQDWEEQLLAARSRLEERVLERTEKLARASEEAQKANEAKSSFLAAMSHEFRTPLNAIIGFSELIQAEYFGPVGQEQYKSYAKDIRESGTHMLTLVNDLLDLSTIEAGKRAFEFTQVDLRVVSEDCMRTLAQVAEAKGIGLSSKMPETIPKITADERSVRQILVNLLSNAVKFTQASGSVTVSVAPANERVAITVSDTGIGIPSEQIAGITAPFAQATTNPHLANEGTGLGLSIVNGLVDAHNGALSIKSELGKGTSVTVELPAERA